MQCSYLFNVKEPQDTMLPRLPCQVVYPNLQVHSRPDVKDILQYESFFRTCSQWRSLAPLFVTFKNTVAQL